MQPSNKFRTRQKHRPLHPYPITNGNLGVYLPKKFHGIDTAGQKMIIDLKTKNVWSAVDRIMSIGLWFQLATCKKATF
jgi:hypothetical protein